MRLLMLTLASGAPYAVNPAAVAGFWPAPPPPANLKDKEGEQGTYIQIIGENDVVKVQQHFAVVTRMVADGANAIWPADHQ